MEDILNCWGELSLRSGEVWVSVLHLETRKSTCWRDKRQALVQREPHTRIIQLLWNADYGQYFLWPYLKGWIMLGLDFKPNVCLRHFFPLYLESSNKIGSYQHVFPFKMVLEQGYIVVLLGSDKVFENRRNRMGACLQHPRTYLWSLSISPSMGCIGDSKSPGYVSILKFFGKEKQNCGCH